ncbi:MAG: hypothetical protein ACKVPX_13170 [Myxococcaceae bacterium]
MASWSRWLFFGVLLLAPVGMAGSRWAIHPVVVLSDENTEKEALERALEKRLSQRNLDAVPASCVAKFVASKPGASCAADESCLAQLAAACGAERALYVAVHIAPARWVFSGSVVSAAGTLDRAASGFVVRREEKAGRDAASEGLERFLDESLGIDDLDLAPLVQERVVPSVPAASVALQSSSGPSPWRIAGWTGVGVGAGLGAAAGILRWTSEADIQRLRTRLDGEGRVPRGDAEGVALDASLQRRARWTTGLLVGAGVVAVAGTLMVVFAPGATVTPSLAVTDKEAVAGLQGSF